MTNITKAFIAASVCALVAWALIYEREARIARERVIPRTPFLVTTRDKLPCPTLHGIDVATSTWIADAAVQAAGWHTPPHLPQLPQDRTPVEYVTTSRGRLLFIQASSRDDVLDSQRGIYPYWLALLQPGELDAWHVPSVRATREISAAMPFFGEIDDAFFLASEGRDGTLSKLDPATLATVRTRSDLAPRPGGTAALSYFIPDGVGGLFFASYGDTGARVHHVDKNLDDVVPARFFTVPHAPTEHWNPRALGVTAENVCVELGCFDNTRNYSGGSNDCGERFLVLDHAFEPTVTAPVDPGVDHAHTHVVWLSAVAVLEWLCALLLLVRNGLVRRVLAKSARAEVLAVEPGAIRLQTDASVVTVSRSRLRVLFGSLRVGECVISPADGVAAPVGYRAIPDIVPREPKRKLGIAMGNAAEIDARAHLSVAIIFGVAFALQTALVITGVMRP